MKRGNNLAHRSLFAQFFLFYMLILLVPIVISGLMYLRSLDIIRTEIDNSNAAVLEKIRLTIDSRLADLENTTVAFNFDTNVTRVIYVRDITAEDRLMMAKVILRLANVTGSNQFVQSLSLYLRNTDIVLTPLSSMTGADFFTAYSDPLYHDDDWSGRKVKLSLDNSIVSKSQATGRLSLAYFRSLPLGDIKGSQALMAIVLDPAEVGAIMTGNSNADSGLFFIVDEDGRYFCPEIGQAYDVDKILGQLSDVGTVQYVRIDGEEMAVSQTLSSDFGLRYLSITPSKVYNRRIDSIRDLYLLSLAACCILGGLLAIYFAKRNYNPIKEIVAKIAGNPAAVRRNFNEYDIIRESIRRIISENDDTRKLVRAQKTSLKNTFLTSLVKGSKNDSQYVADGLSFFDISFERPGFAVIICSLNRFNVDGNDHEKAFIIPQAEQLFSQLGGCVLIEIEDGVIGLLNLPADADYERLRQTANHLINSLKSMNGIVLTVAMSGICTELSQIGTAYREAEHALEYRMLAGSGSVICFPEVNNSTRNNIAGSRSPHDSQQLANSLKSGDIRAARNILRSIINDEFYARSITIPIAKCKMSVLIDTMMTAIEEFPTGSTSEASLDKSACIEALLACKTIAELRQVMEDILDQIEDFILQAKTGKCEKLRSDILAYIAEHYSEMDFNVSNVAYHFGMSIDGVSRFFKKNMNTGLLTYINEQRIEQAVILMEQGMNIKTAAESVGFSNSDAYIRVFKKVKGTTPGKYRDNMIDKKDE